MLPSCGSSRALGSPVGSRLKFANKLCPWKPAVYSGAGTHGHRQYTWTPRRRMDASEVPGSRRNVMASESADVKRKTEATKVTKAMEATASRLAKVMRVIHEKEATLELLPPDHRERVPLQEQLAALEQQAVFLLQQQLAALQQEVSHMSTAGGVPQGIPCSPSDFSIGHFKYDAGKLVAIDRPFGPPPKVLPAEMMFQPFLQFQMDLQSGQPSANCDALVMEMVDILGEYYEDEKRDRAPNVRRVLLELFDLAGMKNTVLKPTGHGRWADDGSSYITVMPNTFMFFLLEVKNELGVSGDGWLQLAASVESELLSLPDEIKESVWPCPVVCVEVVGSHLRIIASMWAGPGSGFIVRAAALTPLIPFQRLSNSHMELLSRLIYAVSRLIPAVRNHYLAVQYPLSADTSLHTRWQVPPPWPLLMLLQMKIVVNPRHFKAAGDHAMYLAELPGPASTPVVVKIVERVGPFGGAQVQDLWAAVGAAPKMHYYQELGGDFHLVVSDYKSPEDGWTSAHDIQDAALLTTVQAEAAKMLGTVQAALECGNTVHGDLRRANTLWRMSGCEMQVCFVDFDRSGDNGVATYPGFVNPHVYRHVGFVQPRKPIFKQHDREMINQWGNEAWP